MREQKPEARMRAQLMRWRKSIDLMEEKAHAPGRPVGFETLLHIDELKALHAVAQSRLDELAASVAMDRAPLELETKTAFSQLSAALEQRRSVTRARKPPEEAEG